MVLEAGARHQPSVRSLKDVTFHLRRSLPGPQLRLLRSLNSAYSFCRHLSPQQILIEGAALAKTIAEMPCPKNTVVEVEQYDIGSDASSYDYEASDEEEVVASLEGAAPVAAVAPPAAATSGRLGPPGPLAFP